MKRLILDHFRRWWWVLGLCAAFTFFIGWQIASLPGQAFEFWVLLVTMWAGANLLSFDLKGGVVRAVAVLPLTGRQIGRSWWLATVAIPAIALSIILFLGAGTACLVHPNKIFPTNRLAMAGLFALPWLATMFALGFPTGGFFARGRERIWTLLISALSTAILFGSMLLCQGATKSLFKSLLLLGGGAVVTVAGWKRAQNFKPGRTGFPVVAAKKSLGQHRAPCGDGGIPFLIKTTFTRSFLTGLLGVVLLLLVMAMVSHKNLQLTGVFAKMSPLILYFSIFQQLTPALSHVRCFRTMPIGVSRLAGVMIAIGILPLIAIAPLVAGCVGLFGGASSVITVLKYSAFFLAPASLSIFFAIWRGLGKLAYFFIFIIFMAFFLGPLWLQVGFNCQELSLGLCVSVTLIGVLLSFLLIRYSLLRSSAPYRVQASPLDNAAWWAGRQV